MAATLHAPGETRAAAADAPLGPELAPELEAVRAYWQDHVTDWPIAQRRAGEP